MIINYRCSLFIIVTLVLLLPISCKEKNHNSEYGLTTFVINKVYLKRGDNAPVQIRLKDKIYPGDIIKTDYGSIVAIQFNENTIIRVSDNVTLKIMKINEDLLDMLVLEGTIAAKLIRSDRRAMVIRTYNSIAAVRGTIFSVKFTNQRSEIAVYEGVVHVEAVPHTVDGVEKGPAGKEISVIAGNTAVVTGSTREMIDQEALLELKQRPISANEKKDLKKIAEMPLITDPSGKDMQDFKNFQKKIIDHEKDIDASLDNETRNKIISLMQNKNRSINDIRKVFNRIDEISLYNGSVIRGAIISRGAVYSVLTTGRVVKIPEKDIQNIRVVK